MHKSLVFGVILSQVICQISSETPPDTTPPTLNIASRIVDADARMVGLNGPYGFYMPNPMMNSPYPFLWRNWGGNFHNIGGEVAADYLIANGIGALKVHSRILPWNRARRTCVEEGGHLAVIRSESEQRIIEQLMLDRSIDDAWVGFHDSFEEGEWMSVLDEPMAATGWARWSKKFKGNPDNYSGHQNCARLVRGSDGMDDDNCERTKPFVCKITAH